MLLTVLLIFIILCDSTKRVESFFVCFVIKCHLFVVCYQLIDNVIATQHPGALRLRY